MNFAYSAEQEQFRASLRRYLDDHPWQAEASPAEVVQVSTRAAGLADLGVYAAMLPEADGGFGFGTVDGTVIAEELGRAVLATSFVETAAIAGGMIAALATPEQKARWLPGIAGGATIALATGLTTHAPIDCGATVSARGERFILAGDTASAVWAPVAEHVLLVARQAGGDPSVFVVDRAALSQGPAFLTIDSLPAATLHLSGLTLGLDMHLGDAGNVAAALAQCLDHAVVLQCAELQGLMATLLNRTLEHLRSRRQFGTALADFQALQHRLADMLLAYEQAVSLTQRAAAACDARAPDRGRAVAACKVQAARSVTLIGNEAIQMHGAIGMTEELIVGPAVKRSKALIARLGAPQFYLDTYRARGSAID